MLGLEYGCGCANCLCLRGLNDRLAHLASQRGQLTNADVLLEKAEANALPSGSHLSHGQVMDVHPICRNDGFMGSIFVLKLRYLQCIYSIYLVTGFCPSA